MMMTSTFRTALLRIVAIATLCFSASYSEAAEPMHHHNAAAASAPPPFVASTAKPFSALMNDAMAVMEDGMQRAPMNGSPDHDFVTMMIPHHQGAVDMAKALLLYNTDPELRNLAQGILTEQQNEIKLMQSWLANHPATKAP
jgi:uncharacterized protein (DUF305 family)